MATTKSRKVRNVIIVIVAIIAVVLLGALIAWRTSPLSIINPVKVAFGGEAQAIDAETYYEADGSYRHATDDDSLAFYMRHPLFEGDTNMMYSTDDNLSRFLNAVSGGTLRQFCELDNAMGSQMSKMAPKIVGGDYAEDAVNQTTEALASEDAKARLIPNDPSETKETTPEEAAAISINAFNYLIDQANAGHIDYISNVYDDEAVAEDPDKAAVHAVFYHGDADKPLAIVMSGGGFVSVGTYSDGYPYAQKLHERGYNVAVLVYRTGSQLHTDDQWQRGVEAVDDLAALVSYLQGHSEELNISLDDYAVIGSSAGGLMATAFSFESLGKSATTYNLPRPAICICSYGLYWDIAPTEADKGLAVFAIAGADDAFGFGGVVDKISTLEESLGADNVNVRIAEHYRHGSNLADGTIFEGWIDEAMDFWEERR